MYKSKVTQNFAILIRSLMSSQRRTKKKKENREKKIKTLEAAKLFAFRVREWFFYKIFWLHII